MKHLILALLLSSCATNGTHTSQVSANIKSSWPNKSWQDYAFEKAKELPRTADEKEWCPQGLTQANWTHLMAAIVKHESNFEPKLQYTESFRREDTGGFVLSTGLFQVSQESARGYGHFVSQEQLHDPYTNIDIAISILKKWTQRDGVVAGGKKGAWLGSSRYWSTLREPKIQKVKEYIKPFCQ